MKKLEKLKINEMQNFAIVNKQEQMEMKGGISSDPTSPYTDPDTDGPNFDLPYSPDDAPLDSPYVPSNPSSPGDNSSSSPYSGLPRF